MHLPLDFHHLAFYVLDEDTVGCVVGGWGVHGDPKSHANLHQEKVCSIQPPTLVPMALQESAGPGLTFSYHLPTDTTTPLGRSP